MREFVDDVQDWWRWGSMRAFAMIGALPAVWIGLPADLKAKVPSEWAPWILTAFALIGAFARVTKKRPK